MKGTVLGFDPDTNTGAISGHDGNRYDFARADWQGQVAPRRGATVDFIADGRRARQIFALAGGGDPSEADTANVVYILYLASLLVGITSIVGVIVAYVNRADAPEWVQSHYRFQIRTFWIALLYSLIGVVTIILVVGVFWLMFVLIWYIVRCVKGMQAISRGQAYERPATWLW